MATIKISGFYITDPGDPSVGIFPQTWELMNGFEFEDDDHLHLFIEGLKAVFGWITDRVEIESFEDRNAREDKIDESYKTRFGNNEGTEDNLPECFTQTIGNGDSLDDFYV